MTLYSLALYVHIVGTLGVFIALGLEWAGLWHLRRAETAGQAREWLGLFAWVRRIGPASLAAILLAGIYMAAASWGGAAWIVVSFASMAALPALGAPSGLRLAALGKAAAEESGTLSPALRRRLREPLLWVSVQTRLGVLLGIVFLMTVKPGLGASLLVMAAAAALGAVSSLPAWKAERADEAAGPSSPLR